MRNRRIWRFVIGITVAVLIIVYLLPKPIYLEGQWIAYFCDVLTPGQHASTSDRAILLTSVTNLSESREIRWVHGPTRVNNPAWSSHALAFENGSGIEVLDLNTGSSYTFGAPLDSGADWSPDGIQIAYVSGLSALAVYDTISSQRTILVDIPRLSTFPTWSSDGAYIATTRSNELVIVDVVRRVVETVAEFETVWHYLEWSPTRNEIAINASLPNNQRAIYLVDVDTGAIQSVIDRNAWAPTWAPDGEWIAFVMSSPETGRQALYKVRRDGTELQEIPTDSRCTTIGAPDWSPDLGQSADY